MADWFCPAYQIPEDTKAQIHQWAQTLPWPEGSSLNDPAKYHVTGLYSPHGYEDPQHHDWVAQQPPVQFPVRPRSIDSFTASPGKNGVPVVLTLDGPELNAHGSNLMDEGEQRGLAVSRFEGGYKPHITLGYSPTPINAEPPAMDFHVGPLFELHSHYDALKRQANILDPIHDTLDPRVWDAPESPEPTLKPMHRDWIYDTIYHTLEKHGYDGMETWLSLVFTGSLTTYQYSDESDVDVSLFVNTKVFPEWSRAEMIGVMVSEVDGTPLPGTPHPVQCFVVSSKLVKEDLYKPGLRSGYDIDLDQWIVPPERERVHDVEREMNESYTIALEAADKMDRLLRYEPHKAVTYWHQIHERRRRDHQRGKGDYAPSNVIYKMLNNRGLFPKISEVSGEYIAKQSMAADPAFLEQWMAENGPYLYHGAQPRNGEDPEEIAQSILTNGLHPNHGREVPEYPARENYRNVDEDGYDADGERDPDLEEWWHHPRPNHVFMTAHENEVYGAPTFRIDLRKLDPQKLKADDDVLRDHYPDQLDFHKFTEPTETNPPRTLGEQADAMGWGDNPEETHDSLERTGVLAHEGPIPPEAIERIR